MNDIKEVTNYEKLATDWLSANCKNATKNEVLTFVELCKVRKLNPFLKEAYFIKFGNNVTIVTNYEKILAIGQNQPNYAGYEYDVYVNGVKSESFDYNDKDVMFKVTIYHYNPITKVREKFTTTRLYLDEYKSSNQGSFKNSYYHSWAEKIALTNAFRRSYSADMEGLYIKEEFEKQLQQQQPITQTTETPKLETQKNNGNISKYQELIKQYEIPREQLKNVIQSFLKDNNLSAKEFNLGNIEPSLFEIYLKENFEIGEVENVDEI